MLRIHSPLAVLLLLLPVLGLASCGSGSDLAGLPADAASPSPSSPTPFEPAPPPAMWADDGCISCHGADGGGAGGGPNIQCTDYERLDTHLRPVTTSHAGGAFPTLTDGELLDLVAFLRTADCPGGGDPTNPSTGIPSTHTKSEDGVLHHPDYETNRATCTTCHGANLEGSSFAPSCASCHGSEGFDDDDDESEREDD